MGEVLAGKYQVEEVLGAGGMGVVVAARHTALRQRVALKFLLPEALQMPGAAARFLREAQAAVAIQSEHVARVLDVGTLENGAPFMVMEHLSGVDLARYTQERGPLPLDEAVDFLLQAGEALAEAHARGIVHRDLKPGNLFLTHRADRSPLVKVLDFGLSKMALVDGGAPEGSLTATDVVIGSPHYMSPEQVRSLKYVDARTDVWALGVILYELLAGRRPFTGPTATAICASVAADKPVPASTHRPELPPQIDAVILACLEKDLARRLPTVAHLARGLSPFAPKRSEASVERILRLLPIAHVLLDSGDTTVTVPLPARASTPEVPAAASTTTGVPPVAPQTVAVASPATDPTTSFGAPLAVTPAVGLAGQGSLACAPGGPATTEPVSGPVGWGRTQPMVRRDPRRSGAYNRLVIGGTALGVVLSVGVVGFVVSRDEEGPAIGETSAAPATPTQGTAALTATVVPSTSVAAVPTASASATGSATTSARPSTTSVPVAAPKPPVTGPSPTVSGASPRPQQVATAGAKTSPGPAKKPDPFDRPN